MATSSRILTRVLSAVGLQRKSTRSFYSGAGGGRLNADWIMSSTSADQEVRSDGRTLRQRARELRRNTGIAERYIKLQVHGILGPTGIKLRAVVGTTRGSTNEAAQSAIETGWRQWGAASVCDVAGTLAWADIERVAVETWKGEGDALLQMVPGFDNGWGFAVQMLDPDQLDDTLNTQATATTNAIKMGVEVNAYGRPVAYHLWTAHPSDIGTRTRVRVPAEQIIHLYTPKRPNQTRGVTAFAPVMYALKMLAGLQEAVIVLMRTAACKMGFFVPNENYEPPKDQAPNIPRRMDAEPGLAMISDVGLDFQPWDPGQPGDNYAPFTLDAKRDIAAGLDVSHAALTGNLAEANYGSQRVGMTLEREGYQRDTAYLARTLHDRVFPVWLSWAVLSGKVNVSASVVQRGAEIAEWQARAFDWIDPERDIDAALKEVDAGLNSLTRIAASKGRDINDILAERAAEQDRAKSLNVELVLHKMTGAPGDPAADKPSTAAPVRLLREGLA